MTVTTDDYKAQTIDRLTTLIPDRRLDWRESLSLAVDAYAVFKVIQEARPNLRHVTSREFYKDRFPGRFMELRNVGVAVRALDLLRSE